jgi:signal transduction histidine kinase
MLQDLALYAELSIFLVGTFMYGFLARELLQQRAILPGNRPIRVLALSLTLWYGGSLADELASILIPGSAIWAAVGPAVDVARALGFLASFSLLAHAVWRMVAPRLAWYWLSICYLSLALFLPSAIDILQRGEMELSSAGRDAYGLFVVHVTLTTLVSAALIGWARSKARRRDLARFLRWLVVTLAAVEGLVLTGATVIDVWSEPVWRILVSSSGLLLGMTFLYFVRAYNVLSLSLSNRSLRHFTSILALLLLILLAGPAIGASGDPVFHRVLAWGLLLAVLGGLLFGPMTRWAVRRSPRVARLFGRSISREDIGALTEALQNLDLSEGRAKELAASEIGRWVGASARFLDAPEPGAALLWSYFEDPRTRAFNRLRAPTATLADALVACELHAVFPVRVGGELEAVLAIPSSAVGGGYEDGEMESIGVVLSQLASTIEIRRLLDARLAAERAQTEHERLSMLGMVSASLAHELKNPLSSMKALAQTVREELERADAASEQAKDLALIVEQVDRLNGVAREVLGFSKPSPSAASTELGGVIASAAYVLDHEARRRGISIDRDGVTHGDAPGPPSTWQTIVFNLMLNAIRHAPDGSTVTLRLDNRGDDVTFECENRGPAIEDDIASKLFDPFVSGASGTSGTGLGLALVERRVREIGGVIDLVNEPDHIVFRVRVQRSMYQT